RASDDSPLGRFGGRGRPGGRGAGRAAGARGRGRRRGRPAAARRRAAAAREHRRGGGRALRRRRARVAARRDRGPGLRRGADGRPLVVVVRDAHRHRWMRDVTTALLADRPDAVVVEIGVPVWRPRAARGYVATNGAGRVSYEVLADRLVGGGSGAGA